jgi:hypothetical protein
MVVTRATAERYRLQWIADLAGVAPALEFRGQAARGIADGWLCAPALTSRGRGPQ